MHLEYENLIREINNLRSKHQNSLENY
jgi:hypothetical protein